jgi:serine/threonine protein kinase
VDLIGRQIGSYVVERELGAGGTGTVFLCSHTMIERKVAVKVLHDDLAYQADQVARFFQEAKAAADIGHPNIVVIIDFGELQTPSGLRSYLMMECLEGASLDKCMRKEKYSLEQIAHIFLQICSALVASHGKGIIHRDLKPANVQLCPRSFDPLFVKLLDFGIAKLAVPSPDSRRTQYGVVLGTPAYMSPEQCDGKGAIDHRSDIYSLGVMLYEMLTGTLPFGGEIRDILMGHLTLSPQPPSQRNPMVPAEWEALCMHMMEKSKERRFQSVSEIAQALFDLPRHAIAYESFAVTHTHSSRSGGTMILDESNDRHAMASRQTLHAAMSPLVAPEAASSTPPPVTSSYPVGRPEVAPLPLPAVEQTPLLASQDHAGMAACYALVTDPRHARFLATLLLRPAARWCNVFELCGASNTAPPATLPAQPLFCTWMDHPWADPSMVSVIFVSLRDGSNTIALCPRASW